ncbi:MAG: diguanylate cyclase, partial [Actinomycetes bacterium]
VMVWASPSTEAALGWHPEQLIGSPAIDLVHPDDRPTLLTWRTESLAGAAVDAIELRILTAAGNYRWMSHQARSITSADGSVTGRVIGLRDAQRQVADRQALAGQTEALARSERRYRLLAENATDVVWQVDAHTVLQWVTPSVESVLGWVPDQLIGTPAADLIHAEDLPAFSAWRDSLLVDPASAPLELRLRTTDGRFRWMSLHARPLAASDGLVSGAVIGLRDVHDEVMAREGLARSEQMFRLAMDGAPQGMAVVGLHGRFMRVNDALCQLVGRSRTWMLKHAVSDVLPSDSLENDHAVRDRLLAAQAEYDIYETPLVTASEDTLWVQHSVGLVRDEHGMPLFYVSQFQDVTAARISRDELQYRVEHDALTGLINREQLQARMTTFLDYEPRRAGVPAVLFCDLDHFKDINDSRGHAAGDYVLKKIARRIAAVLRETDEVARLGGDEFVVVLPEATDYSAAIEVAEKIRTAVARPLPVGDKTITITMSVGVALARPGIDAHRLLRDADFALYQAKNSGRDRVGAFEPF